ncbi:MAG: MerR family transcriptional regulator [Paludibacteraceae bacterium]|nr:MerR family transcriptional regulator [Paludibacteraceae bacterium]MBP5455779.1 MerR family transcriptional regulator [Paludibacteraceae bacterium]
MSYKTKLKIGEFSKMMQVTVKALRHYEQKGLLSPDEVDEWTGYRYYTVGQMQKLQAIRGLQRLGFSLDEIKELYEDDSHTPEIQQIDEKIVETERQLKQLTTRLDRLLEWKNSRKKVTKMEKFSVQSLPEIIVASHREIIPNYAALGPLCVEKIGPEMHRLGCKCPPPGYCFTVEHNKEYTPTNVDIEYCEQVEEMGEDSAIIQFKRLPVVPKALCMKHVGPYERFYESFTEAFRYIEEHGYKVVGQPRTTYVDGAWNQDDPEKWLSIIQIPIE